MIEPRQCTNNLVGDPALVSLFISTFFVLGVTAFEIMLAHIMTQLIIVVLQVALVIGFTLFAFEVSRYNIKF